MSGEYSGWGRTSHLGVSKQVFTGLQHVDELFHAAKSLCHLSAHIVAFFPSMLGSNASIIVLESDFP